MRRRCSCALARLGGLALAGAVTWEAALAHAPGHVHAHAAFGEAGDARQPTRVVRIAMREQGGRMLFVPDRVEVRRGEQIRFVLSNEGMVNHEFVLGTRRDIEAHAKEMNAHPGMEHDDAHSRTLGMYGSDELVWRFTEPGRFVYACLIPGHLEKGMIGTVVVTDK